MVKQDLPDDIHKYYILPLILDLMKKIGYLIDNSNNYYLH
jgi:hypothetical protein